MCQASCYLLNTCLLAILHSKSSMGKLTLLKQTNCFFCKMGKNLVCWGLGSILWLGNVRKSHETQSRSQVYLEIDYIAISLSVSLYVTNTYRCISVVYVGCIIQ